MLCIKYSLAETYKIVPDTNFNALNYNRKLTPKKT